MSSPVRLAKGKESASSSCPLPIVGNSAVLGAAACLFNTVKVNDMNRAAVAETASKPPTDKECRRGLRGHRVDRFIELPAQSTKRLNWSFKLLAAEVCLPTRHFRLRFVRGQDVACCVLFVRQYWCLLEHADHDVGVRLSSAPSIVVQATLQHVSASN